MAAARRGHVHERRARCRSGPARPPRTRPREEPAKPRRGRSGIGARADHHRADQPAHPGAGRGLVDGGQQHEPGAAVQASRRMADHGAGDWKDGRRAHQDRPARARTRSAAQRGTPPTRRRGRRRGGSDAAVPAVDASTAAIGQPVASAKAAVSATRVAACAAATSTPPAPATIRVRSRARPALGSRPPRRTKSAKIALPSASDWPTSPAARIHIRTRAPTALPQ